MFRVDYDIRTLLKAREVINLSDSIILLSFLATTVNQALIFLTNLEFTYLRIHLFKHVFTCLFTSDSKQKCGKTRNQSFDQ